MTGITLNLTASAARNLGIALSEYADAADSKSATQNYFFYGERRVCFSVQPDCVKSDQKYRVHKSSPMRVCGLTLEGAVVEACALADFKIDHIRYGARVGWESFCNAIAKYIDDEGVYHMGNDVSIVKDNY